MDIQKTTVMPERVVLDTAAQAELESAIPLPQGKLAEKVLSAMAEVSVSSAVATAEGVQTEGTLLLNVVCCDTDGMPFAFEASAAFSHCVAAEGLSSEMNARVRAELMHCVCRVEDGGLRLRAVVQLRVLVLGSRAVTCIERLEEVKAAEQRTETVQLCKRAFLGAHALRVRETLDVPMGFSFLCAEGSVKTAAPARGSEETLVAGELLLAVRFLRGDGAIAAQSYTIPFSDAVPSEPNDAVTVPVTLTRLRCELVEDGKLAVEAVLSIGLYGTVKTETSVLVDAYDSEGSFTCVTETFECLCYEGVKTQIVPIHETLTVPNHCREVAVPLYACCMPAVTAVVRDENGTSVDGMLRVTVVYRGDDGKQESFHAELPLSVPIRTEATTVLPAFSVSEVSVQGSGRTVRLAANLTVETEGYRQDTVRLTTDLIAGEAREPYSGIVVYFCEEQETFFDVGKRFGLPLECVRSWNPNAVEPFASGTPLLVVREN